jgi:hypothetical protein
VAATKVSGVRWIMTLLLLRSFFPFFLVGSFFSLFLFIIFPGIFLQLCHCTLRMDRRTHSAASLFQYSVVDPSFYRMSHVH